MNQTSVLSQRIQETVFIDNLLFYNVSLTIIDSVHSREWTKSLVKKVLLRKNYKNIQDLTKNKSKATSLNHHLQYLL